MLSFFITNRKKKRNKCYGLWNLIPKYQRYKTEAEMLNKLADIKTHKNKYNEK